MVNFSKPSVANVAGTVVVATGIIGLFAFMKAYRYVREYHHVFEEMGLPELPEKGWTGGWWNYMARKDDLFGLELELIRKYGKVYGYFEGRQPAIMMADPEMLKQVMIKDFENFHDRRNLFANRDSPIGVALTTLTGDRWRHVRQQLSPAFTPANLHRMEPLLTRVADQLIRNVGAQADKENGSFDAKDYAGYYTLDAIASVAFALEIDSFNNQNSPFVKKTRQVFASKPLTGGFVAALLMFPNFIQTIMNLSPLWAMVRKLFQFFQDVVEAEMDRRRKQGPGTAVRHDLLAITMAAEKDPSDPANKDYIEFDDMGDLWLKNGLTRKEIVGQAILFILAGYETTATTLSMVLLALSENPDKQEKLYQELQKTFAKQEITIDLLNRQKYLEMVINETLRYYCPLLRFDRTCTADTTINGLKIPKGMLIAVPVNAIHHDPDLWQDPEVFEPERFQDPSAIRSGAFMPFGAGNRSCIGMRLAMTELKLALARLVLDFKFTLSPETRMEMPIRWLPTGFRNPHCKIMLKPERRLT